jgi:lysine-specific demethylase/histidyl-hydroxylase NO66
MGPREKRVLAGLAEALGLEGQAHSSFHVLKACAEALGCTVHADGTTEVQVSTGDAVRAQRARFPQHPPHRRRPASPPPQPPLSDGEAPASSGEAPEAPGAKRARVEATSGGVEASGESGDDGGESGGSGSDSEYEGTDDSEASSDSDADSEGTLDPEEESRLFLEPLEIEDRRPSGAPGALSPADPAASAPGFAALEWMLEPLDAATFEAAVFERQPALVSRPARRGHHAGVFSLADLEAALRGGLRYGTQVDVTSYKDGRRSTLNYNGKAAPRARAGEDGGEDGGGGASNSPVELADPGVVLRRFRAGGCSVRLLHPQRASAPLWRLLAGLEARLGAAAGCNAYLTPAGTQGFAPHFDDIDAFVLQAEGAKRWRLYAPGPGLAAGWPLPRYPSRDLARAELGACILDAVLRPGDLLYMPRGTIHEAEALPGEHSLHLTVSANQGRSWAALLECALPRAAAAAALADRRLRATLPVGWARGQGSVPAAAGDAEEAARRAGFARGARRAARAALGALDLAAAVDEWAEEFALSRLPPPGARRAPPGAARRLGLDSRVAPAAPGAAHVALDGDVAVVTHCLRNSRAGHAAADSGGGGGSDSDEEGGAPAQLEFPAGAAAAARALLDGGATRARDAEPEPGCGVGALELARGLMDAGLLVAE